MLFLFVLMLVGVDTSDSLVETLRGQRLAAFVLGLGFAGLLISAIASGVGSGDGVGLEEANAEGNVIGIARLLFTRYVFAFEVTSALLITAALGAMVLAHKEKGADHLNQRQLARARFASGHPYPLPGPGVFAEHDSTATPALLPDGSEAPGSVDSALLEPHVGDTGSTVHG
jgi:NADH-quinone oxidoreductase subunit J